MAAKAITENTLFYGDNLVILREHLLSELLPDTSEVPLYQRTFHLRLYGGGQSSESAVSRTGGKREYMANAENVLLLGSQGLGKTHLALSLGVAACRQAKRVRFYKTAALVNDLHLAQRDLTLSEMMAKFAKLDLLILDELGFIAVDQEGANLLFQLGSSLYERVSLIVTSNLRFQEWTSIFGSATLTQSVIERLIHRGNIFEFVGESYRYRHRLRQDGKEVEEKKS